MPGAYFQDRTWRPKCDPWMPPDYDDGVVYAVRALGEGKANDGQQKLLWDWLMYVTAASEAWADLSFRPGGPESERATAFAEGKRFVGLQMRKMLHPALTPKSVTSNQKPETGKRQRAARSR